MSSRKQVAVCALSSQQRLARGANVFSLSMPWCANSRATLFRRPGIVINCDHDCPLRHHIRVQPPYVIRRGVRTLIGVLSD